MSVAVDIARVHHRQKDAGLMADHISGTLVAVRVHQMRTGHCIIRSQRRLALDVLSVTRLL